MSLWSWDIEVEFETWGLSLNSLQISLIVAFLRKLNLELAHLLLNKRSRLCVLSSFNSSISLFILKFDVINPGIRIEVSLFKDHVDSLLESWNLS